MQVAREIKAYVEALTRAHVRGWVLDTSDPQNILDVELLVDDIAVATARAHNERPDLAVLEAGRTDLGFVLNVPPGTRLDVARTSVRIAGTGIIMPVTYEAAVLEGVIDHRDPKSFGGWAWKAGCLAERVWLAILYEGQQVARVQANLERPDLVRAGVGDGKHGFMIDLAALPPHAVSCPDKIEVTFEANGRALHDVTLEDPHAPSRFKAAKSQVAFAPSPSAVASSLSPELLDALRGSLSLGDGDKDLAF